MACSHKRKRSTCSIWQIKTAQAWVRGALQKMLKTANCLIELKPSKRLGVLNFPQTIMTLFSVKLSWNYVVVPLWYVGLLGTVLRHNLLFSHLPHLLPLFLWGPHIHTCTRLRLLSFDLLGCLRWRWREIVSVITLKKCFSLLSEICFLSVTVSFSFFFFFLSLEKKKWFLKMI